MDFVPPLPPLPAPTSSLAARAAPAEGRATPEGTARDFEAMFLAQTFEQMLKTLPATSFGGGHGAETWRHFLARSMADEVARSGRSGIAESLLPYLEEPDR